MSDLAAQIRARLDGWAPTSAPDDLGQFPALAVTSVDELSPEQAAEWAAAWEQLLGDQPIQPLKIVHPARFYPGFEQMRDALLGVVDLATKFQTIAVIAAPATAEARARIREHGAAQEALVLAVNAIAEKLGIEVDHG